METCCFTADSNRSVPSQCSLKFNFVRDNNERTKSCKTIALYIDIWAIIVTLIPTWRFTFSWCLLGPMLIYRAIVLHDFVRLLFHAQYSKAQEAFQKALDDARCSKWYDWDLRVDSDCMYTECPIESSLRLRYPIYCETVCGVCVCVHVCVCVCVCRGFSSPVWIYPLNLSMTDRQTETDSNGNTRILLYIILEYKLLGMPQTQL